MIKGKKKEKKDKKDKNTKAIIKLMIVIAFFLFVILVSRMAINYYSSIVKKDIAYNGRLVDQINISGLVLYDYDSYDALEGYSLIKTYEEGSRIRVNSLIGSLVSTNNPLYNDLVEINDQIQKKQQLYEINTGIISEDIKIIDNQVRKSLLSFSSVLSSQTLSDVQMHKERIEALNEYLNDVKSGNNEKQQQLDELYVQQQQLKQAMASDVFDVVAVNSGYLSYNSQYNQQYHTYEQMKAVYPSHLHDEMVDNNQTELSVAVKVATSKKFHIAVVLSSSDAARIKDIEDLKININTSGMDVYIDISKVIIGNSEDNETVVFFEVDNGLSQLVSLGKFDGLLVIKEYEGLKIPINAIYNYKYSSFQKMQVALVKGISVKFVYIDVLYTDGTYAIVEDIDEDYSFKVYDYYILDPYSVSDGDVVN